MKTLIALLTLAGVAAAAAAAEARPVNQGVDRISIAAGSGELTVRELSRLRQDQAALARYLDIAQRDGRISKAEREQLDRLEDRVDRHLYRLGHNNRAPR